MAEIVWVLVGLGAIAVGVLVWRKRKAQTAGGGSGGSASDSQPPSNQI